MSICLADATTSETMTAAQAFVLPAILLPFGLVIAFFAGVFRRDSVVGPARLSRRDSSTGLLWILTLLGFFVWMLVPLMYVSATHRGVAATTESTAATKNESVVLSPSEEVALAASAPLAGLIALLAFDSIAMKKRDDEPTLIAWLGFTRRHLARGVAIGLLGALVAVPLTLSVSNITQWVIERLQFGQPKDHTLIQIFTDPNSRALRGVITLSAVVIAPLFEELIFRGHLQSAIAGTMQMLFDTTKQLRGESNSPTAAARWIAIVIAAALFAAVHESGWMRPPLFVLAVCIGYVYERTGNLWAAISMHALFNALSISEVVLGR